MGLSPDRSWKERGIRVTNEPQPSTAPKAREERKPVVLQVVPELDVPGGTERSTVEIAQALGAAGWGALVASAGGSMQHQIESAGARHIEMPLKGKNPIQIRKNAGRLAELIAAERVDIIHARSRAPAWSALHAAQKTGCHFITTFHGAYGTSGSLKRRYNAVMTKGELVIANSEFTANHIMHTYPMEQKNLRVIRRGVDISIYNPGAVTQARVIQLAGQWRLPDGKSVIMLPGRLTAWKGHRVLLDALTHLTRDDYVVVFVGDEQGRAEYRHQLERQVEQNDLGHIVRFAGPCRDMPAAYMSADVVVSASTKPEAFGRVIVEGQAMGRPVVAFDHGGAKETILGGETGLLVEPGNAAELAQALGAALDLGAERRKSMAEVAIRHIAENFTLEKMCASTLAVYEEVLAADAPGER
ncbi:MAG: glycosyltransferase family 4 protein [Rhodospirillaceae bacterium]|nr:glycosyltransferase family 4 protein [Rhodospirillaceae bacterium]MBT5040562.1 glycosyltransferase family 4 protein [Rhodospirillaceae bacterium]MBT5779706.1 glycosyltransferase family 4 protein [Rhodospirillaceae bacterium]